MKSSAGHNKSMDVERGQIASYQTSLLNLELRVAARAPSSQPLDLFFYLRRIKYFMLIGKEFCLGVLLLLLCGGASVGQQPVVQTSPSPALAQNKAAFQTRPITEWVGERFVFMPRQPSLGRYGYLFVYRIDRIAEEIAYDDYVGKIAKVSAVSPGVNGAQGVWKVYLQIEGTEEKLFADAFDRVIEDLAYWRDIEDARAKYLGKTLRVREPQLKTHNLISGKIESFTVPKDSPVKVIDVAVSWNRKAPVRFTVETSQKKTGFADVSMSGTNLEESLREDNRFNSKFVSAD